MLKVCFANMFIHYDIDKQFIISSNSDAIGITLAMTLKFPKLLKHRQILILMDLIVYG
jgi:hypothetical protein